MTQFRILICSDYSLVSDSGSIMHGILMDLLPQPWPARLHETGLKPFSQWVESQSGGKVVWHIGVLDEELASVLRNSLVLNTSIYCKHTRNEIRFLSTEARDLSLQEYLNDFVLAEEPDQDIRLFFKTATAHKSQGEYVILPSVELIARSLQKRFGQIDPECILADDEVVGHIIDNTKLIRYKLESTPYNLEGTRVFGYTGSLNLRFQGETTLKRLSTALFCMAGWSGVGIKTALGMGGCKVIRLNTTHSSEKE